MYFQSVLSNENKTFADNNLYNCCDMFIQIIQRNVKYFMKTELCLNILDNFSIPEKNFER